MKKRWSAVCLTLLLGLSAAAQDPKRVKPSAQDDPTPPPQRAQVELSDGKAPLQELRPLDRRVHVISLNGKWKKPAASGASYQLTVRFPNGRTYSHRPLNDAQFAAGKMRFLVPEYMLVRGKTARGDKLGLFVTERLTGTDRPEAISNTVEVSWPLERGRARPR